MSRLGVSWIVSLLLGCDGGTPAQDRTGDGAALGSQQVPAEGTLTTCDVKGVANIAEALPEIPHADKRRATAVGLGLACADALPAPYLAFFAAVKDGVAKTPELLMAENRERTLWEQKACPDRDEALAMVAKAPPHQKGRALYIRCDLEDEGVVKVSGPLSPQATLMPWAVRARLLDQGIDLKQANAITGALVGLEVETFGALAVRKRQNLPKAPRGAALQGGAPQVFVGPTELSLGGRTVFSLGTPDAPFERRFLKSHLITMLYEGLSEHAPELQGVQGNEAAKLPQLVIAADGRTPFVNLVNVAYTSARAKFSNYGLAVQLPDGRHGVLPIGPAPFVPALSEADKKQAQEGQDEKQSELNLRIHIGAAGYYLSVHGLDINKDLPNVSALDSDAPMHDPAHWNDVTLAAKIVEYKKAFPNERGVIISADLEVPVAALAQVLVATRGEACDPANEDTCLFPNAMLALELSAPPEGEGEGEGEPWGGLGLSGIGGDGEGSIGLGNRGLIGTKGDGGGDLGYGRERGAGFGGRGKRGPQVRQAKATVTGPLDKNIIRRIVRAHINEVRSCYNAGLAKDPELRGRLTIDFVIGAAGKVSMAKIAHSTLSDKSVATCIAGAVKRWKFPKPLGGEVVTVQYPFSLSPG